MPLLVSITKIRAFFLVEVLPRHSVALFGARLTNHTPRTQLLTCDQIFGPFSHRVFFFSFPHSDIVNNFVTMGVFCYFAEKKIVSLLPLLVCICVAEMAVGQVRYSIPEEMATGSVVGNIIQDLGLDIKRLKSGRARIFTEDDSEYIGLNSEKGTLVVAKRIDREELCKQVSPCSLHFQIILENPMELHRIDVEILDINDNAPYFSKKEYNFQVIESASPGARYSLESASDPDVAMNTIQTYKLNPSDNFKLNVVSLPDGTKYIEMVLHTSLDREKQEEHKLTLTAFDGGNP